MTAPTIIAPHQTPSRHVNASVGLEQEEVRNWVSGKFVLQVLENAERDKEFHMTVELSPGVEATAKIADVIGTSIRKQLLRLNSEFANYVPPAHQALRVTLRPSGLSTFRRA